MSITVNVVITHDGPSELEIKLIDYFEKKKPNLRYYVNSRTYPPESRYPQYRYLHSDGILRPSAMNEDNQLTGWFPTLGEVIKAINKYVELQKPPSDSLSPAVPEKDSLSEVKAADTKESLHDNLQ